MTEQSLESIEPQKQCKQTMICELFTMQKDIHVHHHLLFLLCNNSIVLWPLTKPYPINLHEVKQRYTF
jgi:hypothetical protein